MSSKDLYRDGSLRSAKWNFGKCDVKMWTEFN
jgi:hypothetical protein